MMTRRMFTPISVLALISLAAPGTARQAAAADTSQTPEQQARKAAETWLAVIDRGEYDASWKNAAEMFRKNVATEQWVRALEGIRTPLGDMVSRTLREAQYATSLPGVRDGEYVVIQFDTSFTEKDAAVETVTTMKEADGAWRVTGYFIK